MNKERGIPKLNALTLPVTAGALIKEGNKLYVCVRKHINLSRWINNQRLHHSDATHLHEQEIDIKYLKELLEHNSLKTTEQNTHVSKRDLRKLKSPLDNLKF